MKTKSYYNGKNSKVERIFKPARGKEIVFENGWKGIISVSGKGTQELSLWDLEVAGKKFTCVPQEKDEFQKYLDSILEPDVDVMFPHSAEIKAPASYRSRKKGKRVKIDKEEKPESTHYNCTVRVPKQYVQSMFDDVAERAKQFVKLLADMCWEQAKKEQEETEAPVRKETK